MERGGSTRVKEGKNNKKRKGRESLITEEMHAEQNSRKGDDNKKASKMKKK